MAKKKRKGLVHVYTGDGKGKTSTSLGLAFRALGHGLKVYMIQFLKGGGHSGELEAALVFPNFTIKQFGKSCPYSERIKSGEMECCSCKDCFLTRNEEREKVDEGLNLAEKILQSGKYDVVILDEINNSLARKLTSVNRIKKMVKERDTSVEIVLTGRNAPKEIIEIADYVTNLKKIKHPFSKGIRARHGIDY